MNQSRVNTGNKQWLGIAAIIIVFIVAAYFLFAKKGSSPQAEKLNTDTTTWIEVGYDSSPVEQSKQPVTTVEVKEEKQAVTEPQEDVTRTEPINSGTRYKVISKAYFYSQPDEQTRKNTFINHWNNSYADIRPRNEKNGFIYVVFTNHLGQTSKGWLRKKDLRDANE